MKESCLNEKLRELIAIGASIGAHCQPCLTFHVEKARELGVSEDEINAAVDVGYMVQKGAMNEIKKHAQNILKPNAKESCGCGSGCCG
ncbi:MAG: carboxymuconolactone decarboxylase family protein [Firmicutes bacterium]|nr:carboxymuconolactone decarboxylase family protein [Bacillota bacterium]